jgi:hypothetical protein
MSAVRFAARPALVALLAIPAALAAQQPLPMKLEPRPTSGPISAADLMTRLYRVADDSMGGRPTGSEGHLKVTQYIADELRRLGLQPAGENGGYFQDLPMTSRGFAAGSRVLVGARSFTIGTDFAPMIARGGQPRVTEAAPVVIGGVHGDSSTWISAEEARGNIVVLRPNPRMLQLDQRFLAISGNSRFAGAAAVVVPAWEQLAAPARAQLSQPSLVMGRELTGPQLPPTLIASNEMVDALIAGAGRRAGLNLRYEVTQAAARNVIAVLPGSDPALRGQYVALGSHTDHDPLVARGVDHDSLRAFGFARERVARATGARRPTPQQLAGVKVNVDSLRALRPARSDSIKNGADDDGSGSVALLELAEAFAATSPVNRPKRSRAVRVARRRGDSGCAWRRALRGEPDGAAGFDRRATEYGHGRPRRCRRTSLACVARSTCSSSARAVSRANSATLVEAVNARQPQSVQASTTASTPMATRSGSTAARTTRRTRRYGVPVTFFHTGLHSRLSPGDGRRSSLAFARGAPPPCACGSPRCARRSAPRSFSAAWRCSRSRAPSRAAAACLMAARSA